jgi:hypothetical protein
MAKKINIVGKRAERIQNTGPSLPRIEPSEFAGALGAEPCGEPHFEHLDPISLLALGNELLKRLRSTGGRPSLEGATEQCKVPLRPEDMKALEEIAKAIEQETDSRPSLGQIASVILKLHLELLRNRAQTAHAEINKLSANEREHGLSPTVVKELVEEQLKPVWEELNRMKKDLAAVTRSNAEH